MQSKLDRPWFSVLCVNRRYTQGSSKLWPRNVKRHLGAGLTYPPGVKPSFARGPLKGRWPAMAAAAATELTRMNGAESAATKMIDAVGGGVVQENAAQFLLAVSLCGLLEARDG